MKKAQQARFDSLYQLHVNALPRQSKAENTIERMPGHLGGMNR